MKQCSIVGCERKHLAKGFCGLHWKRNKYGEDMLAPDKKSGINQYSTDGNVTTLYLTFRSEVKECYIDTVDHRLVQSVGRRFYAVQFKNTFYAMTKTIEDGGILLHRLLLGLIYDDRLIDHKDGNGLNDRRDNIRIATTTLNSPNKHGLVSLNTSGYAGVYKRYNRWVANIGYKGKTRWLGSYETKEEAAKVVEEFRSKAISLEVV